MLIGKMTLAVALVLLFAVVACAQEPSFDCAKADTRAEKMICTDSELATLDVALGKTYREVLTKSPDPSSFKYKQRAWIKERDKCPDIKCLKVAYWNRSRELKNLLVQAGGLSSSAQYEKSNFTANMPLEKPDSGRASVADSSNLTGQDHPGAYILDKSTNNNLCLPLGHIINADIKKYGKMRFDTHSEFVKWREIDGDVAKYTYDGKVEQTDIDINNDGTVEQVVKTKWSIGRAPNDQLSIFNKTIPNVTPSELQKANKTIAFNQGRYWIDRMNKKSGDPLVIDWGWYFSGVASIDLFQQENAIYVVAANIYPPDVPAKIYVFQLDKEFRDYEETDMCMFLRIFPDNK